MGRVGCAGKSRVDHGSGSPAGRVGSCRSRSCLSPAIGWYLMLAGRPAANPLHAAAAVDRRDRQRKDGRKDRQTDTRQFHRPCSGYYSEITTVYFFLISPLGIYVLYRQTYVLPQLLISLFNFSLLVLRSQNQRLDGSWVCYEQMSVWSDFNIPWLDSSPRPPIFPKFAKNLTVLSLIWRVVITKRLNI